jgi:hypothetical protein
MQHDVILIHSSREISGNFYVDEEILRQEGIKDFSRSAVTPGMKDEELKPDFFI